MGYEGHDRRRRSGTDPITVADLDEALVLHAAKEREYLREVIAELMVAFPAGDLRGHHDYHVRKIKVAQAEEEFWKTAKLTLIQAGVAGIIRLVWVIFLLIALGLTVKFAMPESVVKFILGLLSR